MATDCAAQVGGCAIFSGFSMPEQRSFSPGATASSPSCQGKFLTFEVCELQVDRTLRATHACVRPAYPRDPRIIPSTLSTRLTRLASPPHVCRPLLFYDVYQRYIVRHDQWCRGANRAASSAKPGIAGPLLEQGWAHSQGSRRGRAWARPSHTVGQPCSRMWPCTVRV